MTGVDLVRTIREALAAGATVRYHRGRPPRAPKALAPQETVRVDVVGQVLREPGRGRESDGYAPLRASRTQAPIGPDGAGISPFAPRRLEFDTNDFVHMELLGLDAHEDE